MRRVLQLLLLAACATPPAAAAAAMLALRQSAFFASSSRASALLQRRSQSPQACICINCKFVNRCKTYHWVEEMHEQPHVTDAPDFDPTDPQIQVFIRTEEDMKSRDDMEVDGRKTRALTTEFDVFECDAFTEDAGKWLRLMPDADFIPT